MIERAIHLNDIEEDVRKAFRTISAHGRKSHDEVKTKLPDIVTVPFSLPAGPTIIIAIDGSFAPIYRMANLWIIAVRAAALTCEFDESKGYNIAQCKVNEAAHLVTTDKAVAQEIDEFTAEVQALTARRPGEAARRMSYLVRIYRELELAAHIAAEKSNVTIALDGTLTTPPIRTIKAQMSALLTASKRNANTLVGISKDSNMNLFGCSIRDEELLEYIGKTELTYVVPPQPRKTSLGPEGTTYFVRLHPDAPKWFRVDVVNTSSRSLDNVFGELAQFSRSQLCLGYPYPLAEAHKAAVELRKFPELYDGLLFKIAAELGIDVNEMIWGRTNIDGRRRDAFHAYLDLISKTGRRQR
jgi:hypothetical protein